jgi:hypothetical protein
MPDPSTISNLVARWQSTSLAQADGTLISSWPDSSGSGNDASQGFAGNQPTLKRSVINGLPALLWDPTNGEDLMTAALSMAAKPRSRVLVGTLSDSSTARSCIGSSVNGGLNISFNGTTPRLLKQGTAVIGSATSTVAVNTPFVLIATYDASGNYTFRLNGTAAGSGTSNQTLTASTATIGRGFSNGEPWRGYIAMILAYDKVLSPEEQATIDSYAQDKYGIAVADYVAPPALISKDTVNVGETGLWTPVSRTTRIGVDL